jgi:hypothetical protein
VFLFILEEIYSLKIVFFKKTSTAKFQTEFSSLEDFSFYQVELIPILLETNELYKIASKNFETFAKTVEGLLITLYIQFHPQSLERVC